MSQSEIKQMAELIIKTQNGKSYFNFSEASKIIGCGVNTVPPLMHENGVIVKQVGRSKRVSAFDIAEVMCTRRTAAIDNRPTRLYAVKGSSQ